MTLEISADKSINVSPEHERALEQRLRAAGMRMTRQRMLLAFLLFRHGDRHLTAERLYEEAKGEGLAVSLATVYNTLNQFLDAGLLRQVVVDSTRSYFDTNLGGHHHFFVESTGELIDVPSKAIQISDLPKAPEGFDMSGVDIVLRLTPKTA